MAKAGPDPRIDAVAGEVTGEHADAVRTPLAQSEVAAGDVAVIGFHGHTVAHKPDRRWTWQVGDGEALARMTGITVVNDLRSADVAAGGQGAPLLPIYHRALAEPLEKPVAILQDRKSVVEGKMWSVESSGGSVSFKKNKDYRIKWRD